MRLVLPEIKHDEAGFSAMTELAAQTTNCHHDQIEVDMSRTTWFDADMCAPFGAILYRSGRNLNNIRLSGIREEVERILSKNAFLSSYGRDKVPDTYGTTSPYQRFDVKDDRYFASYIERELVRRPEFPKMSIGLLKKFRESVFEIFSNAVIHSEAKLGVFSCGQYFPKRHRLALSVADLGIGIRENLRRRRGLDREAHEAITWALEAANTTKSGTIPGGLGLKLLREFIMKNEGTLQIVSDRGYWALLAGQARTQRLRNPFPGTVVSIEINTADTHSYALTSEVSAADIF
jgi:hypothetical protein